MAVPRPAPSSAWRLACNGMRSVGGIGSGRLEVTIAMFKEF